jgi:DNA-binding CsgD family transcriptional regulator
LWRSPGAAVPRLFPSPDISDFSGSSGLSAREFEVARLVAGGMTNREIGMTNREIASALAIAPKTAAAHVEHIRTELGVSRRAQIAAWVAGLSFDRGTSNGP